MRIDFEWDPAKAAGNSSKHGVTFDFADPLALSLLDHDPSASEERWITLGLASTGNLLLVVHTWAEIDADRSAI